MELLASICNKESATGKADPGVYLYRIDTESGAVTPVPTEHPDLEPANGMTGLCHHGGKIIGVRQQRPNQLVVLDPVSWAVEHVWSLKHSMAGHSLLSHDGSLYLVATGIDSVLRITPPTGEEVIWSHGAADADTIHCNGITLHKGSVHISGFGPKPGKLWGTAEAGFVLDVQSGERAISGIFHPHTVTDVAGELWWCESARMSVCNARGQRLTIADSYCRGLMVTDDQLIVGTSTGRKKSESTGQVLELNTARGRLAGACRVLVFDRVGDDVADSRLKLEIDLSGRGDEIYDLLPLPPHMG